MIAAMVAVFALVVASCADDDGGETGATGGTTPTGATATGATGETGFPAFTTLEEGVLQAANCLDYPPFESVVDGDEVGFDIDLVEAVAERLGLTVEWIRADFDTVFTAVAGNQFDMVAAAATITSEREEVVDFSDPYYNSLQALTVNTAETPDLTSYEQLGEGDTVAVQKGTTGKLFAEENIVPLGAELVTFQLNSDMFRELEGGGVTALVTDAPASLEIVTGPPGPRGGATDRHDGAVRVRVLAIEPGTARCHQPRARAGDRRRNVRGDLRDILPTGGPAAGVRADGLTRRTDSSEGARRRRRGPLRRRWRWVWRS